MGKKVISVLLCIALVAAAVCAVVFKKDANAKAADLAAAQADLAAAKTELTTAASDLETAKTELATSASDLETALADLATSQADLTTAQADLATANETIAALQTAAAESVPAADLTAAQAEATRLQNAYDLQKAYVEKLEKRATALLTAQAEIDVLNAKLAAKETESADANAALEADVARLQNAYDLQKAYVAKLEKRATDLLTAQAQIDVLNAQLAAYENAEAEEETEEPVEAVDTAALEAEVTRLQNAYDLQKAYVAKLEKRATDLLTAQAQIDLLNAKLASYENAAD